jgi:ATP-dependent Clp protease adapter protein ClpS
VSSGWRVIVHDDDVNNMDLVCYALHRVCGIPVEDAAGLTFDVHTKGSADVGAYSHRSDAERAAVALQRYGLHASLRPA